MPIERLQALDNVEKEIASCIQIAGMLIVFNSSFNSILSNSQIIINSHVYAMQSGMALQELSKDKASMKAVENHTSQFLKTLSHVEGELSKHINYLTQVSTGNYIFKKSF